MDTMYDRIKNMNKDEMKQFIYWVYMCGNVDGGKGLCDSESGYFGGHILNRSVQSIMPNNSTDDLWDIFEKVYKNNS